MDHSDRMVTTMDEERRNKIMAEARATLARVNDREANGWTTSPDEPTRDLVCKDLDMPPMEDPVAKWKREADEFTAECEQAKADLHEQERQGRELVQVDARIAQATAHERNVQAATIEEHVRHERDILEVTIAGVLKRQRAELADHKAQIARMLDLHEAKIKGWLAAIEPRLDKLAEVRAELGTLRQEVLGSRRIH
jgi:hypothetical protein